MQGFLRQSTASQSRMLGPFVDDTDFKTLETGLTIANTDIKLCANGNASVDKNSGGATHRVNGLYSITLDATDTATVGELEVSIAVSGALVVKKTFTVLEEAIYDSLFASGAASLATAASITALNDIDSAAVTDACDAALVLYHLDHLLAVAYNAATPPGVAASFLNALTENNGLGTPRLTSDALTQNGIGTNGASLSAIPWNSAWDAEVQSECADAITAAAPIDANMTQIQGHALAGTGTQVADGFEFFFNVGTPTQTMEDVGGGGGGGSSDWTTTEKNQIRHRLGVDGTTGTPVTNSPNLGTVSANVTQLASDGAAADNLQADYDGTGYNKSTSTIGTCTTNTDMRGTDSANTTTPPTVGAIADAVWDEPRSGHVTTGTYGEHTGDAAMRGTDSANTATPPTAAAIRTEMDSNSTQLAAIVADTNELQADWANGGRLDLILDARASQTSVDTIDGIVDSLLVIANKLDDTLELDGAIYRFSTNALEQAPAGGGGGSGDITSIMGTNLTETAGGQLASAFSNFYDVATPSKTVNDVGVAGSGLSAADVWSYDISSVSTDGQAGKEIQDLPADINTLLSSKSVNVSNPVDPSTNRLTLVQRADYKTTSAMGAIRKAVPLSFTGVTAGDVVRFGATEEDQGETISKAGTVVDVSGTLYAQIELTSTETNKTASRQWRWELQHENGSGEVSPIVADAEMVLATSHADS